MNATLTVLLTVCKAFRQHVLSVQEVQDACQGFRSSMRMNDASPSLSFGSPKELVQRFGLIIFLIRPIHPKFRCVFSCLFTPIRQVLFVSSAVYWLLSTPKLVQFIGGLEVSCDMSLGIVLLPVSDAFQFVKASPSFVGL